MYQISTFAKLSKTSIQTLRYYDNLDLLKPKVIGQYNNYRYYTKEQLVLVEKIKMLKQMGFKLKSIMQILNKYDEKSLTTQCDNLKEEVKNKLASIKELEIIIKKAKNNDHSFQKELVNLINNKERSKIKMREKYKAAQAKYLECYKLYHDNDLPGCFELLEELKNDIFVEKDNFEPFWDHAAGDLFTGIAFEVIKQNKLEDITFLNVYKFNIKGNEVIDNLAEYTNKLDKDSYSYLCLSGISSAPIDTKSSIIAVFKQTMKLFAMYDVSK